MTDGTDAAETTARVRFTLGADAKAPLRWGDRVTLDGLGGAPWRDLGVIVRGDVAPGGSAEGFLRFATTAERDRLERGGSRPFESRDGAVGAALPLDGTEWRSGAWVDRLCGVLRDAAADGQDVAALLSRAKAEREAVAWRRATAPLDDASVALAAIARGLGPTGYGRNPGTRVATAAALFRLLGVRCLGDAGSEFGHADDGIHGLIDRAVDQGALLLTDEESPGMFTRTLRAPHLLEGNVEALSPVHSITAAALLGDCASAKLRSLRWAVARVTNDEPTAQAWFGRDDGATREEGLGILGTFGLTKRL